VSVLVAMPRAHYSGEVLGELRDALGARLGGGPLEEHVRLGLGEHALVHFAVAADAAALDDAARAELTDAVVRIVRTWDERLAEALVARHAAAGEGSRARFAPAFPDAYRAAVAVEQAAEDVSMLAEVVASGNAARPPAARRGAARRRSGSTSPRRRPRSPSACPSWSTSASARSPPIRWRCRSAGRRRSTC
jgi:glutamate dehydrogenase